VRTEERITEAIFGATMDRHEFHIQYVTAPRTHDVNDLYFRPSQAPLHSS
jgi:hypothetical protein